MGRIRKGDEDDDLEELKEWGKASLPVRDRTVENSLGIMVYKASLFFLLF